MWATKTTSDLTWIPFTRTEYATESTVYIRVDRIEAYDDTTIWTDDGRTYDNLIGVLSTMEKALG
jgi:hypothetical protein